MDCARHYRPTAAYQVTVVLIESQRQTFAAAGAVAQYPIAVEPDSADSGNRIDQVSRLADRRPARRGHRTRRATDGAQHVLLRRMRGSAWSNTIAGHQRDLRRPCTPACRRIRFTTRPASTALSCAWSVAPTLRRSPPASSADHCAASRRLGEPARRRKRRSDTHADLHAAGLAEPERVAAARWHRGVRRTLRRADRDADFHLPRLDTSGVPRAPACRWCRQPHRQPRGESAGVHRAAARGVALSPQSHPNGEFPLVGTAHRAT